MPFTGFKQNFAYSLELNELWARPASAGRDLLSPMMQHVEESGRER